MEMEIQGDGADMILGDLLGAVGTAQLPGDLVMQIVSRLPVKSILRFKSVCRVWCALFSSPMFIQHHCHMANSSNKINNLLSFFIRTNDDNLGNPIFFLLVDRLCGERTSMLLNPPFECHLDDIQVVGSINGLVCLNLYTNPTFIVLWNPATRKHWQIPNPNLSAARHEHESLGFAYDEDTDSYRVIRILYSKPSGQLRHPHGEEIYRTRVEIYSTGTNTWRTKEDVDFPWFYQITCGTVVSGSPYWYAVEHVRHGLSFRKHVMWFDPSVEAFRFHPLRFRQLFSGRLGLGAIGEQPVVFCESFRREKDEAFTLLDIWKLNKCDDGGSEPIYGEKLTLEFVSSLRLGTALGFRGNGRVIALNESGALVICDPHSTQFEIIHHRGAAWGWWPKVYDYTESLASPSTVA